MRFKLNGRAVEGEAEPRMLLTDFLRHVLGMTGTHVGCEHGVCGACTIEIDGAPGRACLMLAVQADGATLRTVEGLAPEPGRLSVLQDAFRRHHALQCGFCTPGILMSLDIYLRDRPSPTETELREFLSGHLCRCTGYVPIVAAALDAAQKLRDAARPCLISAPASWRAWRAIPNALAIVDGDVRLTYRQWYERISALVAGFDELELEPGDHLVTLLQNRWEAATIHWACQFAGIIITPLNWRSTAEELDYCLANADAKALVYEEVSAARGRLRPKKRSTTRASRSACRTTFRSRRWSRTPVDDVQPRVDAEAWSVMLYTSGTTAKPKGVPRRQRAERAAALAHVAQNLYRNGERTLGVMPLYHTMGVRSLIAMSLIGGTFVCLPRFDVARALELIAAEKVTNLYLVPTLYHDLVHHERFKRTDVSSVRKLGFAGASMTDGLLKGLQAAIQAGTVRQPLRLVGNLHLHHRPGRADEARLGRPRRHQPDGARGAPWRGVARRGRKARRRRRDRRAARGR